MQRSTKLHKRVRHKTGKAACTYRTMVTHLRLFDDAVACWYVAQIAITKIARYTPIH